MIRGDDPARTRRIQVALDEPELETLDDTNGSGSGAAGDARGDSGGDDAEAGETAAPPQDPADSGPGSAALAAPGRVDFQSVGFAYRPGLPVLEDITLALEPGTVTALVGPSGSGKSTLASLLARFHDPQTGRVTVGGTDLRRFTADELYERVGFVFQQTQLVHGTVHENIALARPEASVSEVEAAARAAQLHERILRLPDGYGTMLGPDAALSGGERQRLTIARAILADTPVLVLDEATAFADPESEYLVQLALDRLAAGRTVLVIAHRLHTVAGVDGIVVLDRGRIAEAGTHAELIAADGRYRKLWAASDAGAVDTAVDPAADDADVEREVR